MQIFVTILLNKKIDSVFVEEFVVKIKVGHFNALKMQRHTTDGRYRSEEGRWSWAAFVVSEALLNVVPQYSSFLRR